MIRLIKGMKEDLDGGFYLPSAPAEELLGVEEP